MTPCQWGQLQLDIRQNKHTVTDTCFSGLPGTRVVIPETKYHPNVDGYTEYVLCEQCHRMWIDG